MSDPSLAVAVRAARNAAAVLSDAAHDLKRLPAFSKEHGDIASAADSEAENAIVTTLLAAFPDHAMLGAEHGTRTRGNPDSMRRWIVDPIDGTANFAHGYPYYAISIALAHGPELTHAVVLDPVRDELFTAIKARGAQLNGVALRVSACTILDHARLDGLWVMSLKSWDVAAGALLVREAGGRVGDFAGGADFLRGDEVIAATPGIFNALREAIGAVTP
jgi:myo-inositol-1(or 4)-monophosphatase